MTRRKRIVIEYDDPELMRNLRLIAAQQNLADVRRLILTDLKKAHPEIGGLLDREISFVSPQKTEVIPKIGENNPVDWA